jgi:uncharacterized membrane protein YtjA (UPF0391 family)
MALERNRLSQVFIPTLFSPGAGLVRNAPKLPVFAHEELPKGVHKMLGWALLFLIVAIVAGVLGFGGIASASAGIAQIIFYIFLVLLVVSLIFHFMRGSSV